jgi:hypothetical protein
MYKGKETCQGCRKSGIEKPRWDKDRLCEECNDLLKLGQARDFDNKIEYVGVSDWHNGYRNIGDISLDKFANAILDALNNPTAKEVERIDFPRAQYSGQTFHKIPKNTAEPLKQFFLDLNEFAKQVSDAKERALSSANSHIFNEKQRIFNEGVDAGKNLLFQLNNGDITISEFGNKLPYSNK